MVFFITIIFIADELHFSIYPSLSLGNLGIFGDSFNVLTSLFTGLAFAGVVISVILQTQELKEAREEFKGQKEALENQEFDNKFFQMLNLFNNIINNLEYKIKPTNIIKGKQIFPILKKKLEEKIKPDSYEIEEDTYKHFKSVFKEFNNDFDISFKYYFINLYQILKYIDKNSNSIEEAKEYTNIVRAQLSKNELVLLFYNAIGVIDFSKDKYKILVEKYAFFEHLRYEDIADIIYEHDHKHNNNNNLVDLLLKEYNKSAFGENDFIKEKRQILLDT